MFWQFTINELITGALCSFLVVFIAVQKKANRGICLRALSVDETIVKPMEHNMVLLKLWTFFISADVTSIYLCALFQIGISKEKINPI